MYIKKLSLQNFRNYDLQEIEFNKNLNIIYGDNAQGKTNIIEAIYLCAIGKSYRTNNDKDFIKFDNNFSTIETQFYKNERDQKIQIKINREKSIFVNDIKVKKLSELIGNINLVIFKPEDINIFRDTPKERRRFFDVLISQLRPQYILNLNNYNKILKDRNNYLKNNPENSNPTLLEVYNEKLADYGCKVYKYRKEFIDKVYEKMKNIHKEVTNEDPTIIYKSDCEKISDFLEHLKRNEKIDFIRGYSTCGIQRDDFNAYLNDKDISLFGSQGQNRSLALSLKLAEIEVIKDEIEEYPILLLDDFMSELDKKRIKSFLHYLKEVQVISTSTDKIELDNCKYFYIKQGRVEE